MSTGEKRPLSQARDEAQEFQNLFDGCDERWQIAGSVRRMKEFVGDVEHVAIPRIATEPAEGLFCEEKNEINVIWRRLEMLVKRGACGKADYTDKNGKVSQRWGNLYRGVLFKGFKHEIFLTTPDSWGAQLLIRTGPADYSRAVVDKIRLAGMYRQQDGALIHVASGKPVPVPDERTYLQIAGLPWQEPMARH